MLYAHNIHANQEDENMLMGKALADIKENDLQEFAFSNLKFDKLSKQHGHYLITEYKKSLKNPEAGKMQLLFYVYLLKTGLNLGGFGSFTMAVMPFRIVSILVKFSALSSMAMTVLPLISLPFTSFKFKPVFKR